MMIMRMMTMTLRWMTIPARSLLFRSTSLKTRLLRSMSRQACIQMVMVIIILRVIVMINVKGTRVLMSPGPLAPLLRSQQSA